MTVPVDMFAYKRR